MQLESGSQELGACHRPSVSSGVLFPPHRCVFSPCPSSVLSEAGEVKRPQPSCLCPVHLDTEPLLRAMACLPFWTHLGHFQGACGLGRNSSTRRVVCPQLPHERLCGDVLHARLRAGPGSRVAHCQLPGPPQAGALGECSGGQGFPSSRLAGPLLPSLPPSLLPSLPPSFHSTVRPFVKCQDALILCSLLLGGGTRGAASCRLRSAGLAPRLGRVSEGEGKEQPWWAFPPA